MPDPESLDNNRHQMSLITLSLFHVLVVGGDDDSVQGEGEGLVDVCEEDAEGPGAATVQVSTVTADSLVSGAVQAGHLPGRVVHSTAPQLPNNFPRIAYTAGGDYYWINCLNHNLT